MEKKKKPNRASAKGFDGVGGKLTEKRLKTLKKNPPHGDWRRWKVMKIKYTLITRVWNYRDDLHNYEVTQRHFAPWGMVQHLQQLLKADVCCNFQALPVEVKEGMPSLQQAFYNPKAMTVSCSNDGDLGYSRFYWLYCTFCMSNVLPGVLELCKDKLPEVPKVEDLIDEWDNIISSNRKVGEFIEVCGTFLPNKADVMAMPNNNKYILRPTNHTKSHIKPNSVPLPQVAVPQEPSLHEPSLQEQPTIPSESSLASPPSPESIAASSSTSSSSSGSASSSSSTLTTAALSSSATATSSSLAATTGLTLSRKRPATEPLQRVFSKTADNTIHYDREGKMSTTAIASIKATKQGKKVDISFKPKACAPRMRNIGQLLDPRISLCDHPKGAVEEFVQNHCLSKILFGVNHNISQKTTVAMYQESAEHDVLKYHNLHLGGIEMDGKVFASPPKVCLNEHNIVDFEHAILNTYKELDTTSMNSSPYSVLRGPFAKYYSIFNDGIQKFSMELNGVMIRTLNPDFDVVNVPWALSKIPGGSMDHTKLVSQIISVINNVQTFGASSFEDAKITFLRNFEAEFPDSIAPSPPSIFRCCKMSSIDFETKSIQLVFENWPVALVADGCSTNVTAGEFLVEHYGLMSPTTRCSAHAASGSIKRISSSKTMCVEEVVTFATGIRPVLRHFQLSGKSTALLNEALAALEMKQIHLMTWCPTRMANLLDASSRAVALLFPLCDVMVSCDIKPEERAYFMSPICLGILHLMADLEELMIGDFLRKLDTDDAIIIDVYGESMSFIESLDSLKTPLYDRFISGLKEDENGNIQYHFESSHLNLQYSARSFRRDIDKVGKIKGELDEVKARIISNLQGNVADQAQSDSIVEYASAFNLNYRCERSVRTEYVRKLYSMYGTTYTHIIDDDKDLPGYHIEITYPAKLQCTEAELLEDFNNIWPVLNKLWLSFKNTLPRKNVTKRFWIKVLEEYSLDFPNIAELILILLAISPGTGPLERSYSKLAKTCYKDRARLSSDTLEVLYLLCTLQVVNHDDEFFMKVREYLQRNK